MAAGNTYALINSQTLGSAQASVAFSSISGAYTDLVLVSNFAGTASGHEIALGINGETGTN